MGISFKLNLSKMQTERQKGELVEKIWFADLRSQWLLFKVNLLFTRNFPLETAFQAESALCKYFCDIFFKFFQFRESDPGNLFFWFELGQGSRSSGPWSPSNLQQSNIQFQRAFYSGKSFGGRSMCSVSAMWTPHRRASGQRLVARETRSNPPQTRIDLA